MWHKTNHSPTLGGVLILTGKNISRMADFKQFCCSIDYYKNQGDSRKIQSSGTNQERIMKPERIGNGTPPMENETPPVENESYPPTVEIKSYPPPMENESENILLTPPVENVRTES
jgi:hypothetical protein